MKVRPRREGGLGREGGGCRVEKVRPRRHGPVVENIKGVVRREGGERGKKNGERRIFVWIENAVSEEKTKQKSLELDN